MTWAGPALVEFAARGSALSVLYAVESDGPAPAARCVHHLVRRHLRRWQGRCRDEHECTETINSMCSPVIDRWRLIVPVKGQLTAKSRLHPPAGVARADLAHAFALDTITAVVAGLPAAHLVVVTSDDLTSAFVRELGGTVV